MSTALNKTQLEESSWLTNAGQDDTIRRLTAMKGTASDIAVLEHAIAKESASATPRSSRLKPMEAKLRKFKASTPAAPAAPDRATILKAAQASLEKHSAALIKHIAAFDKITLANKLGLGLACLKAHMAFAMIDPAKRGQGRKKANQVTRDEISEGGFEGWLVEIEADLKKPLAYKYMTAVRGLGLDHTATDRDIINELKRREKKGETVNLAALIDAATEAITPPVLPPPPPEQLTFDDWKATLRTFREDSETLIEQVKDMPEDLRKAALARTYATLHALTGTHWQPSDDPHELGTLDPDSIVI